MLTLIYLFISCGKCHTNKTSNKIYLLQKKAVKSAPLNAPPKPRIDAASEGGVVLSGVVSFLNIVFMFFNRVLKKIRI